MAKLLWGNVYYKDILAGSLREETNQQISFTYNESYLNSQNPAIAYSLPLQRTPHISNLGLHPFFDNLVAEGWLENAQTRLLAKRITSRFELLLTFGYDCAGAVSIIDPEPSSLFESMLDMQNSKEMADFINNTQGCLPIESYSLYGRILAGLLLGNTDMHLKNFALFRSNNSMRLTPSYDQVSASLYDYKTVALTLAGADNLHISNLKAKHIIKLGEEFSLSNEAINMIVKQLAKNKEAAKEAIFEAKIGQIKLKDQLIDMMKKRWNGIFALIGQHLLTKQ